MKFSLTAFGDVSPYETEVLLIIRPDCISCQFKVQGPIDLLLDPKGSSAPDRFQENLWQASCFELFIDEGPSYVEWNIARDSSWTRYQFQDYRQDCRIIRDQRPFSFNKLESPKDLIIEFDLPHRGPIHALSPCCILKTKEQCSYFAVQHLGEQADFHRRDSFIKVRT